MTHKPPGRAKREREGPAAWTCLDLCYQRARVASVGGLPGTAVCHFRCCDTTVAPAPPPLSEREKGAFTVVSERRRLDQSGGLCVYIAGSVTQLSHRLGEGRGERGGRERINSPGRVDT